MIENQLIGSALCALPGVIVFVELCLILPLKKQVLCILQDSNKSVHVLKSTNISDHWKQRVLPQYSWHIMRSTLNITFILIIMFLGFVGTYCIFGIILIGGLEQITESLSKLRIQGVIVLLGMLYALLRRNISNFKQQKNSDYTLLSRVLHRIILDSSIIKEMAFDIDTILTRKITEKPNLLPPVYISGLARAGTTILLESLYSTGYFTTLTYRDMPLVTAPYLWSKITQKSKIKEEKRKQRAHGDFIYVNYDSPEAFEEVFWLTFSNMDYVKEDHLDLQDVDKELVEKYKRYIENIIKRDSKNKFLCYLAKNNNNLLRINAIKAAFPDAIFIVPFRNPIDHAKSLLNQHKEFLNRHAQDPFAHKYMNWLGHFEFGANLKPFRFYQESLPLNKEETQHIDYWLRYWRTVYAYLLEFQAANILFFNYDLLCQQPELHFEKLESKLSLESGSLQKFSTSINRSPRSYLNQIEDPSLSPETKEIYYKLQEAAI